MEVSADILDSFTRILFRHEVFMITRKSFFIRWLTVSNDEKQQEEHYVIDIKHIQSGANQRVLSPEEASLWMRERNADDVEKKKNVEETTKVKKENL